MKTAKDIKRDIGDITLQNVERYIRINNWKLVYYGNGGAEDEYIESLGLSRYARRVNSFSYRDDNVILVAVRDSIEDADKAFLALHEIAHIVLGHNLSNLCVKEEREANRFAEKCIGDRRPRGVWFVLLFAVALCAVLLIGRPAENMLRQDGPAPPASSSIISDDTSVYITPSGDKYHAADCIYIDGRDGVLKIKKSEAIDMGKEPCKVCRP